MRTSERRVRDVVSWVAGEACRPAGWLTAAARRLALMTALALAGCAGSQDLAQPTISTPVTADPTAAPPPT